MFTIGDLKNKRIEYSHQILDLYDKIVPNLPDFPSFAIFTTMLFILTKTYCPNSDDEFFEHLQCAVYNYLHGDIARIEIHSCDEIDPGMVN